MSTLEYISTLLREGSAGTQEDIRIALLNRGLEVNQSTISRSLRKLGAIRRTTTNGEMHYYLPETIANISPSLSSKLHPLKNDSIDSVVKDMMVNIQTNGYLIVINTSPGSASLLARVLDNKKPEGILGTVAGDDTIFVAPASKDKIPVTIQSIRSLLANA